MVAIASHADWRTPEDIKASHLKANILKSGRVVFNMLRATPSLPDLLTYLMDQHGLTRAGMAPILGTPSRVSEVLSGKKGLSMAMVQRLRARFRIPPIC